ncbi:MAG: hypothetical protein L6W00_08960 [Lentisphaeria bacterium]|nr:MAG: hypothetical protein L6W00_08960 [Lentisphaeria bacterium]
MRVEVTAPVEVVLDRRNGRFRHFGFLLFRIRRPNCRWRRNESGFRKRRRRRNESGFRKRQFRFRCGRFRYDRFRYSGRFRRSGPRREAERWNGSSRAHRLRTLRSRRRREHGRFRRRERSCLRFLRRLRNDDGLHCATLAAAKMDLFAGLGVETVLLTAIGTTEFHFHPASPMQ